MDKKNILDLSKNDLSLLLQEMCQPSFRTKQLLNGIYQKLYTDFWEFANIPVLLRQELDNKFVINPLIVENHIATKDKLTEKLLFKLQDGATIESVLMRFERRNTLCVSTQVGCPMGCVFCATGQMGFTRNLTSGEILAQILYFQRKLRDEGEALRNIVYMGMGEPFLNYANVSNSLYSISDPEMIGLGARHITVSTVGIIPKIFLFGKDHPQVNLAISLHAPNDTLRSQLLPANRIYPLFALMKACREYIAMTNRKLTFEYALINSVNDSDILAHEFANLVKGMLTIVNLITLNASQEYPTPGSPQERVQDFRDILVHHGIRTTVRFRRGIEINAGCGQLASQQKLK